jgi:predicted nucleic acid-binding protein
MTAFFDLMELRSVLAKKKAFERDRIERIEDRIARKTTVIFLDASDIVAANTLQQETLLYPMDGIVLAAADSVECPLVSFDSELRDHGAVEPAELLSD